MSKSNAPWSPQWQWFITGVLLTVIATAILVFPQAGPFFIQGLWWAMGLVVVGIALWVVASTGVLSWMRRAWGPSRALARGNAAAAERAFDAALARARRFAREDHRRARMLVALSEYLKQVGRYAQAQDFLQEAVAILEPQWKMYPVDAFIALNNLAVVHIRLHDYRAAQCMLEKVLDLTLVWSKGGSNTHSVTLFGLPQPALELVFHLNLVTLFVYMDALDLAAEHCELADELAARTKRPPQLRDHYHRVRASLSLAQGDAGQATEELRKARDTADPAHLAARARICLAQKSYQEAEELIRKTMAIMGKHSSTLRPDFLEPMLDLAESLAGTGRHDEAFGAVKEAHDIARHYAMTKTAFWRKAVEKWLDRAEHLGRAADKRWLEAKLHPLASSDEHSITVSPRLRGPRSVL